MKATVHAQGAPEYSLEAGGASPASRSPAALRWRDPPILLPMAAYHGTLAAVRCLGRAGIPVTVADSVRFVPAVWSRFVKRRVRCPRPDEPERFIEWLLEFGAREPGHVLYPTTDDVAWLYARHRDELSNHYNLCIPDLEVTRLLLNKVRLQAAARTVGLPMPRTWLPEDEEGFDEIVRQARFPLVIKPRSQVLLRPHAKGVTVDRPGDLRRAYAGFISAVAYAPCVLADDPGLSRPCVQEYSPEAAENVYGISGFIDETGELFAARASRKLLQHPGQLGVGLCFEEAEVRPDLEAKVFALCRRLGYHGVFEAEFIERDGTSLLIDFNPRFFGQMAFDVARGLPLPLFAYQAAIGDGRRLRQQIGAARARHHRPIRAYCRSFELKLFLTLRRLCGTLSREAARRWWAWLEEHRRSMVDAVFDAEDRLPGSVEAVHQLAGYARHPRAFFRQVIRG